MLLHTVLQRLAAPLSAAAALTRSMAPAAPVALTRTRRRP